MDNEDKKTMYGIESNWFDWTDAANMEDSELTDWIHEGVEEVRTHVAKGMPLPIVWQVACGDRVVQVACWHEERDIEVNIFKPLHSCDFKARSLLEIKEPTK